MRKNILAVLAFFSLTISIFITIKNFNFDFDFETRIKKENHLPDITVEKVVEEPTASEGTFKGKFGENYVDIEIKGKTVMFAYKEKEIEEKIDALEPGDHIVFEYLFNESTDNKLLTKIDD